MKKVFNFLTVLLLAFALGITPIRNASNNDLTFVHISYLSSYHGSWYQNSTGEAGCTSNVIYIPSSTYGSGTFISG